MVNESNPYQNPTVESSQGPWLRTRLGVSPHLICVWAYFTSVVVAIAFVLIWLFVWFSNDSVPPGQREPRPIDIVEVLFIFAATLPSVMTCIGFTFAYCLMVKDPERRRVWPAVIFGGLSGLVFNAINAIHVIEHFFNW